MHRNCPSCTQNSQHVMFEEVPVTMTAPTGKLSRSHYCLVACTSCDTIFLSPTPNARDLYYMYSEATQFSSDTYRSDERVAAVLEHYLSTLRRIKPDLGETTRRLQLLEVGAGLSWLSRAAKIDNKDGWFTVAQDVTSECSNSCEWVDHYIVGSVEEIEVSAHGKYDIISMTHVIEHLPNPADVLRRLRDLILPNGALLVTAPHLPENWASGDDLSQWERWSYHHVPGHLQYFSRRGLTLIARASGFNLASWSLAENGQVFEAVLKPLPAVDTEHQVTTTTHVPDVTARMDSPINADVIANAHHHARQFAEAKPFKHVVIDNFLEQKIAQALLDNFPSVQDTSKLVNEFGKPHPKSAISDISSLQPPYHTLDNYIKTRAFLGLIEKITGIADLLYDPDYFGGGTHENFHSAGLDPHFDFNIHPRLGTHRRVNLIIYLNKDWDPSWKGSICFHSNPWDVDNDQIREVQTAFNRCVIFETTESSWHSVPPVDLPPDKRELSRKSFTIYLYTKTRPPEEAAVSHGTVYVQPNLSPHIKPGHVLTQSDINEFKTNITRRNEYLRNLYQREYAFERHIADLKNYITSLEKCMHLPIQGSVRLQEVSAPPYADLENMFMNRIVRFKINILRPASKARLTFWSPASVDKHSNVSFVMGNTSATRSVIPGELTEIELQFEHPLTGTVDAKVECDRSCRASPTDARDISVIIHNIEILH